jgi:hypothetical protein
MEPLWLCAHIYVARSVVHKHQAPFRRPGWRLRWLLSRAAAALTPAAPPAFGPAAGLSRASTLADSGPAALALEAELARHIQRVVSMVGRGTGLAAPGWRVSGWQHGAGVAAPAGGAARSQRQPANLGTTAATATSAHRATRQLTTHHHPRHPRAADG